MPASGGEGDEMEEVSDAEMQAHGNAGMEPPPVQERARKRRKRARQRQRRTSDIQDVLPCPECKALQLLDLPVALLLEILRLVGNLQSADAGARARNDAYMDLCAAEERHGEGLQFCAFWTKEVRDFFKDMLRFDQSEARHKARNSFTNDDFTDAEWHAAMAAAEAEVKQRPRQLDTRCRRFYSEKLEEFLKYFNGIKIQNDPMTYERGSLDFFVYIKEASKPSLQALERQLVTHLPPDIRFATEP